MNNFKCLQPLIHFRAGKLNDLGGRLKNLDQGRC